MSQLEELRNAMGNMHSALRNIDLPQLQSCAYKEIRRCIEVSPAYLQMMYRNLHSDFTREELDPAVIFFRSFEHLSSTHRRTRNLEYLESLACYKEVLIFWFGNYFSQLDPNDFYRVFRINCCNSGGTHSQNCYSNIREFLDALLACLEPH